MANQLTIHHPSNQTGTHGNGSRGFIRSASLLGLLILSGLIAQNLSGFLYQKGFSGMLSLIAGFAILAVVAVVFFKPLYKIIDTPHFAISGLLAIATGTALGTFVSQTVPPEVFTQRYGETGSSVLRFFQLDDVFHSWWYVSLYATLALSLVKISLKKKYNWENIGFHLAHLSPIVILFGFWVDYFYGFRGIIQLEEGQAKNIVQVYDGHTNYLKDSTELPFSIQLDKFQFEKHDPDYRLQIWRMDQQAHAREVAHHENQEPAQPEILASFPLDLMKPRKIYGTDIRFRLTDFYPDFTFEYTYPLIIDTIEARDPGIQLEAKTDFGDAAIQLRGNQPGKNKIADETIVGAWLEFYWELPADLAAGLNRQPVDEKLAEINRVIFAGNERKIYFLIDRKLSAEPLENNKFYPIESKEGAGFTILHLFPDAAYLKATPATKSDELNNPVAMVEIWNKKIPGSKQAYLYPGNAERRGGNFAIPGTSYFLALESFKDMETKFFKSDLTVLNKNGEAIHRQSVKVNEPMLHGGYRFYQTDYDPKRPTYSGIGVSHEPGLYVIYFGFFVLVAGVAQMFYGRTRKNEV
jgi:hypothetical protein